MTEATEWKAIPGYPSYQINKEGVVRHGHTKKVKELKTLSGVGLTVKLRSQTLGWHELVISKLLYDLFSEDEWRTVSRFPNYEMSHKGTVRMKGGNDLKPIFVGDEGYLGFALKRGIGYHLKGLHELFATTFPEQVKKAA